MSRNHIFSCCYLYNVPACCYWHIPCSALRFKYLSAGRFVYFIAADWVKNSEKGSDMVVFEQIRISETVRIKILATRPGDAPVLFTIEKTGDSGRVLNHTLSVPADKIPALIEVLEKCVRKKAA